MTHPELPHNLEAEKATLGSILLNREAIVAVAPWLLPSYFYMERHAQLYEAMLACYNARIPPDTRTVSEELRRRNQLDAVGGIMYLSNLVDIVPTSYHVEYYARIIERTALLRQLINAGGKIAALGYNEQDELEDTLDKAEQTLFEVSQRRSTQDFVPISQVIDAYYEQITYLQEHRGEVVGVPTGFRDLDEITGGLQQSDLIILAARPSVGKTAFVLSLAYNVATRNQRTVGIFSLEMSRDQLVQRLLAMDTRIDTHRLRTGHVGEAELQAVMDSMGRLAAVPIYIEDTPGLSIMEVRSKARRLQAQAGVDLIIIDYLQLMAGRRTDNRVQEVSEISRGLKALAREINVPVIALSQLSRAVEGRTSHVPMLSDLRESGCLAGDTLVYLPDEGIYQRIDALVGQRSFNVLALNTETWKLEPRPVLNAFATGKKPVYRMKTRLGRSILATVNHKFLTIQGWRRLDQLSIGERLAVPFNAPARNYSTDALPAMNSLHGAREATPLRATNSSQVLITTRIALENIARIVGDRKGSPLRCDVFDDIQRISLIPANDIATIADGREEPPRRNDDDDRRRYDDGVDDDANTPIALLATPTPPVGATARDRPTARSLAAMIVAKTALANTFHGDVYWDEIVSIEPEGETEVYDLTVDGLHNFVAGDIVAHNSIEQDADIVMFIYREELYDRETDKKGIAELHIAKHRNGPIGVVPMRFNAATTRFDDLSYRTSEGY